ncbi:HAD-IIIC family phosphatase [Oceanospirillum beijerinckii]|uniref:HAD-IIIC family phosphatase n=1 Tax=Oceanospirillum beijerinckii TaxID=64976 RepID=UPI000419D06C|nr:HAD-IIIC family phosphatase [Oceanospirillum beijerinckii]
MKNLKYREIIKKNRDLEPLVENNCYRIAILSNIVIHQAKDICEYALRDQGVGALVTLGEYDNIVQDSFKYTDKNAVVIFWELCNLVDGLQYKYRNFNSEAVDSLIEKVRQEIDLVLNNLSDISVVVFNKFSSLIFNDIQLHANQLDRICQQLNNHLEKHKNKNLYLVDINKIISRVSVDGATDMRYFLSSKALYTIDMYKEYFSRIAPIVLSNSGKTKKAIILDCDNTLWSGVLGETGFENIEMFEEIQQLAVSLASRGVIVCLCSKNNPEDVDEVLKHHSDMVLRDEHIIIKMVNWKNKASNIRAIADMLNIGLDSLVFVDDSDFEVSLIKNELPMVTTFKVPNKRHEYSRLIKYIEEVFYAPFETIEDKNKISIYKEQIKRQSAKEDSLSIEDYLRSLGLTIYVEINQVDHIARYSQMTQKTNQFNLTTKRYSERDIEIFMQSDNKSVISISVSDKFGDSGITGLCILEFSDSSAFIDTFLMSCRVLGRNIELKFIDVIVDFVRKSNISVLKSRYTKTLKNDQVSDLFEKLGFDLHSIDDKGKNYLLNVDNYFFKNIDYIEVCYER